MTDRTALPHPARHQHHRLSAVLLALLALIATAVPAALAWHAVTSGANASDTEEVGLNRLGAATLDIEVGRSRTGDVLGAPEEAALRAENLAPGDMVTGSLDLQNAGSLPLRYAVTAETDGGPLAAWLLFHVWTGRDACEAGIGTATEVVRTNLVLTTSPVSLVGDPATGHQSGDRSLAPGQGESLCFAASLPISAPNSAQETSLGFDLIIDAEHDLDVSETGDVGETSETNP